MNKTLLYIALLTSSAFFGCTGDKPVDCVENPMRRSCMEACVEDPTLSYCSLPDGGPDTGNPDGSIDGGPDSASPCPVACTDGTPFCDDVSMECVQCLSPVDCEGMGVNTMCLEGRCVQCMGNADCTQPGASVCATDGITAGSCVGCTVGGVDDCAGVMEGATALNVCDDSAGSGVCVECNARDELACGMKVCDVREQTCKDDAMMDSAEACEPCVSDRQCEEGLACVPVGATEPRNYYCMKDNGGGCERPFTIDLTGRVSISRLAAATYCGINESLASCENVRSLLDDAMCPSGMDDECPEGGLCRRKGSLTNRCTYECGGPVQCDAAPNPGSTCGNATNGDMGPDYCGGEPE